MEKTTALSIEKSGCLKLHREEYKLINDRKHFILHCEINSKFRKTQILKIVYTLLNPSTPRQVEKKLGSFMKQSLEPRS